MLVSHKINTWGHLLAAPQATNSVESGPNFYDQLRRPDRVVSQPAGIVISKPDVPIWGYDQEPSYKKIHL